MNTRTVRRALVAATVGLASIIVASPASADDLDADVIAAAICPGGSEYLDVETDTFGEDGDAELYSYGVDGGALCTFALITTDDDTRLEGSYTVSVGAAQVSGPLNGSAMATSPVVTDAGPGAAAVLAASGQEVSVGLKKVSKGAKKAALKKYSVAKKKYTKAYAKAGKTAQAKKTMKRKISVAKRKYRAATAPRVTVTKTPFATRIELPLDIEAD
jgi:hypothetical protein